MSATIPVLLRITVVSLLLTLAGCAWLRPPPTPILPPDELSKLGDTELERKSFQDARDHYIKIVERHPNSSYAPRARFLIGEAYYREGEFDKAVKEFETFMAFYPKGYGLPLPLVYLVWLIVVVSLYPLCRWVASVKARRTDWWLSYL